ncbi:hypothetical protein [Cylindrospermopsis raciborskii]|uniref:Uncharacterized protein n=1 Tax=Cylindrospermopsis raciborskii CS-506_A TaxID=2585140 RepID=A0A838WRR7_9CYAN|nr:hypothetical protein [Cylindrospermopsis raciborskii]MBA4445182.1 hypothetical protein [Cylindrospermopsis raciborskii CS-506_C]MBA4449398.1 hypothetical protein [Cylindrospermopsis raciborskii CS-506_D]MBA4456043.1 hypothetical protein [Cylindrospermopsis raciborskii CS-506_B]MBA4465383.1 hypothetical protein [Cylindrospermopsis raciborskii CS-506_A]OHY34808.1 hypothetical protein BCV63_03080 [Cylindrospermopsis raciborskii CS-508]
MNRTTIKNFAIWARNHLKEQVSTRATQLTITEKTITEKTITDQRTFAGGLLSGEQTLNSEEAKQYQKLHSHIEYLLKQQASKNLDKKFNSNNRRKQLSRVVEKNKRGSDFDGGFNIHTVISLGDQIDQRLPQHQPRECFAIALKFL